jgi:flagellar motor protein MotB
VDVLCSGYGAHRATASLSPGDTTRLPIVVNPIDTTTVDSDSSFQMRTVPGDALFQPNEWRLRDDAAIARIEEIGFALRAQLRPDEVVAVAGHTDDSPFREGADKDNWMLSGERAASAARVLTDPEYGIGLPECQVVTLGFGPSRPVQPIDSLDSRATREQKRRANRRIEFFVLRGDALAWGGCG